MKKTIAIAAIFISAMSNAQTPAADSISHSDTTTKAYIAKLSYPPVMPISKQATPKVDLNLPKCNIANGFVIIPIPHRNKKKKNFEQY